MKKSMTRIVLILAPWVAALAYRPGELILNILGLESFGRAHYAGMLYETRAFGDSMTFSVLSFGVIVLALGVFTATSQRLSTKQLFLVGTATTILICLPVVRWRLADVLSDWGLVQVSPYLSFSSVEEYVRFQNICMAAIGIAVIPLCFFLAQQNLRQKRVQGCDRSFQ